MLLLSSTAEGLFNNKLYTTQRQEAGRHILADRASNDAVHDYALEAAQGKRRGTKAFERDGRDRGHFELYGNEMRNHFPFVLE